MDSDAASRRSILGLGGLASLCCVGPGTAAVAGGGAAGGVGAGLLEVVAIAVTLAVVAVVLRRRTGCTACEA